VVGLGVKVAIANCGYLIIYGVFKLLIVSARKYLSQDKVKTGLDRDCPDISTPLATLYH
jgi:hypothetical protein